MEFLRPLRIPHPLNLDHNKSQFGERLRVSACREERPASHAPALRSRINVINDGIFLLRIEVRWLEKQSIKIRRAITSLHRDRFGRLPSRRDELRNVCFLERCQRLPIRSAQHAHRRRIRLRKIIHKIPPRSRKRHIVVRIFGCQQFQPAAVKTDAVKVREIRNALFSAIGQEIQRPRLLIDPQQLGHHKFALGDLIFELSAT